MNEAHTAVLIFAGINLAILIGKKYAVFLVHKFFEVGQKLNPPEEMKKRMLPFGLSEPFLDRCLIPDLKGIERFVFWSALINLIGAVLIYTITTTLIEG